MKVLSLCFALFFIHQSWAVEIELATITSDATTDSTVFFLETNKDGSTQGFREITTDEHGRVTFDLFHTIAEVRLNGVMLKEMEGREIIRLYLDDDFSNVTGGIVKLRYLSSGVTGSHYYHYIALGKLNGQFVLKDTEGNPINKIFIKGRWSGILRRWIGVSYITSSFEAL